jgi:hypothetical protein
MPFLGRSPHLLSPVTQKTVPQTPKSAKDELLASFGELIDTAAKSLTHKEFIKATEKARTMFKRAIAAHSLPHRTV